MVICRLSLSLVILFASFGHLSRYFVVFRGLWSSFTVCRLFSRSLVVFYGLSQSLVVFCRFFVICHCIWWFCSLLSSFVVLWRLPQSLIIFAHFWFLPSAFVFRLSFGCLLSYLVIIHGVRSLCPSFAVFCHALQSLFVFCCLWLSFAVLSSLLRSLVVFRGVP